MNEVFLIYGTGIVIYGLIMGVYFNTDWELLERSEQLFISFLALLWPLFFLTLVLMTPIRIGALIGGIKWK